MHEALLVGISGGASVAVFAGMATMLKIEELRWKLAIAGTAVGIAKIVINL